MTEKEEIEKLLEEAKVNRKYEECTKNFGRKPTAGEFLSWTGNRGKEYAAETGNPIPSPNRLHTALSAPDFEEWLTAHAGRLGWGTTDGDGAKESKALVMANLGLAAKFALKMSGRRVPTKDLIHEGCIGLMRAIKLYEWERGTLFSTYALWHVKQYVRRATETKANCIRTPIHTRDSQWDEATKVAIHNAKNVISLDQPIGGNEDNSKLYETIYDSRAKDPAEEAATRLDLDTLLGAISHLTEKEATVVRMRFGLDGGQAMTLDEVGQTMSLTRERIRQIETKALHKLKLVVAKDTQKEKAA